MAQIISLKFFSEQLQKETFCQAVLPDCYQTDGSHYPVLFLLHGLFGNGTNFLELTNITEYLRGRNLIVILPEGCDGWYTDGATNVADKFESYFWEDLLPTVKKHLRLIDKREARAIAGISMGGYGALKYAARKPEMFAFAGALSGVFDAAEKNAENPGFDWLNLDSSITKTFSEKGSRTRVENDLFQLFGSFSETEIAKLPYIYLSCGNDDGFIQTSRNFAGLLRDKKIAFEYDEVSGGHDWNYWDQQLAELLSVLEDKILRPTSQI